MQSHDVVVPAAAQAIAIIPRDPEVAAANAANAAKAPSPAAQEQPVAPPQKDSIIDLTLESDDEVDTKEHLQLPQVLNGRPAPKPGYRTFVEGEPILWTLETDVQGMKNLVKDREDVFAKQRKVNVDPNLKREGLRRAQAFLKNNGDPRVANAFEAYLRFCQGCDTRPFPMTKAMLALCLFAKSSRADKGHASFKRELTRVQGAIRGLFDGVDGYEDLEQLGPFALDDFVHERDHLRMSNDDRHKNGKTSPSGSLLPADTRAPPDAVNPAVPAPQVREYAEDSSDEEEGTDSDSEDDGDNWSADEHAEPNELGDSELDSYATKVKKQLPTSLNSFETLDDLFGQVVAAVVPVYGISVYKSSCSSGSGGIRCNRSVGHWDGTPIGHCPFRLQVIKIDGEWVVDETRSTYSHSHGPTRGILNNPNWLPKNKNPVARKVMGLPTLPSNTTTENGKVRHRSTAASPIPKKRKHDQRDGSSKFKAQKQDKEEKRNAPVAAKPVYFEAQFSGQQVEQQPPVGQYFEPFQLPTPAVVVPAAATFAQPANSSGFIPILQSILGIWNGRLVPLAPALVAAGVSSFADLGGLFNMPQVALTATLAAVRDHAIPAQGSSADGQYWDGLVSLLADKIKEEGRR
ncbi:hypothetical protein NBRC10513_005640 [Rhodotorula toruloides]